MHFPLRALCALACLSALSTFAQDSKSVAPRPSTAPVISDEARIKAIQEYWTPERLAAAKPMPLPRVDPAGVTPSNAPSRPEPMRVGEPVLPTLHQEAEVENRTERFPLNQGPDVDDEATPRPDGFSYEMPFNNYRTGINNQFPYSTMGKLFFTIPAGVPGEAPGGYVCSAAVVGNVRLVVTARHCMFDYASQKWYSNWAFYPEWNNGHSSVVGGQSGAWYPEWVATWTSSGTLNLTGGWDIGIMVMHDSPGTGCGGDKGYQIGNYTGAMGWTYGGDFSQRQWNMFGYPQAAPFEGNYLYQNNGATGTVNPLGSTNVVMAGDPQTGGTSGGPWVIGFNPNNATVPSPNNNTNPGGNNYDNGVNSFVWTNPNEPLAMNGTIFQQANFYNLYTYALGLKCT